MGGGAGGFAPPAEGVGVNPREGTALGCIGRCKVCGLAIQLRRTTVFMSGSVTPGEEDRWGHFVATDHLAELSPGVTS